MKTYTKEEWLKNFNQSVILFNTLKDLAGASLDLDVDATSALDDWSKLISCFDIKLLDGDPSFTETYLEQLQEMNLELRRLFVTRRDSLANALNKQQKTTASIKAYQKD